MTNFGAFSKPTRRLLTQAMEDPAFRTKFFNDRKSLYGTFNVPESETAVLETNLFKGVSTETEFVERLSDLTGIAWSG